MSSAKALLFTLAMTILCSCATQRFLISGKPVSRSPDSEQMQIFFLNGVGQTQTVDAEKVCKGKQISHVEAKMSFVDFILSSVTGGLFTPRTTKVYCKG